MQESSGFPSPAIESRAAGGDNSQGAEKGMAIRNSNTLLKLMLAGLVLLAVAGVALLGAYWYLSRPQPATASWTTPIDAIQPDAVAADLATLTLAGEPEERVIRAALDAGELESAYGTLAYSVLLPDGTRGGQWALLATRYGGAPGDAAARAVDPGRAALAYRAVMDQAALSPTLSDVVRAGLALQAAGGMAGLKQDAAARLALAEAESIARYSLTLLPTQRREILEQIAAGYHGLGDRATATRLENQIARASLGPGIKLAPLPDYLSTMRGSVVLPAGLVTAVAARQREAAALAGGWLAAAPDERERLAGALGRALQDEDTARADFYATSAALAPADQLAMLHDRVNWLTIKYRVAQKAYGGSLVPAWEGQVEDLRAQLVAAYTDLINGYGRQLETLEPGEAAAARLQLLQQALLWTRLGLFPGNAEDNLQGQLIDAARGLWSRRGGAGLVIVTQEAGGQRYYLLSGSSEEPGATPAAGK